MNTAAPVALPLCEFIYSLPRTQGTFHLPSHNFSVEVCDVRSFSAGFRSSHQTNGCTVR